MNFKREKKNWEENLEIEAAMFKHKKEHRGTTKRNRNVRNQVKILKSVLKISYLNLGSATLPALLPGSRPGLSRVFNLCISGRGVDGGGRFCLNRA